MDRLTQEVGFDGRVQNYQYNAAGQLIRSDDAGNRNCTHPDLNTPLTNTLPVWYHNRIQRDERYVYEYDKFGNLTEKRPYRNGWREAPRGAIGHFAYDQAHRLTRFTAEEDGQTLTQARYIYDPLGRRVGKLVTQINPQSAETETQNIWFGWDGDRLVLTENRDTQLHTIYHPNSFVPLLRAEHVRMEDSHRSLAEKLEEENGSAFPTELHLRLNEVEKDIRKNHLSDDNQQWLDAVGLKAENLALWLDPLPQGDALKLHLYHCDHLGTPIALINHKTSKVEWSAVLDVWGNAVDVFNPYKLRQQIRMQGQQYDEESGLHYNRHRYYDPMQGRYITQDPIGLRGGWNLYTYALDPIEFIDPLGLYQVCHRKFDPVPVPYARHCYIKFENGTTSSFDNKGVHADPAPNKAGTICTEHQNSSLDECIREAMKNCKGKDYNFTEFNCCHCAEQAMKSCGAFLPKISWPNFPANPGPQPGESGYSRDPVFGSSLGGE
ncbi:RHS repeat-associated core domain-containing protein [Rahnella selenatireducens]|uniref:RHS repeat-associated core domain-containing protein n=1 Tax=Rahnella selenatireducens TaxID=3389797 RepID=UPI00396807CA